MNLAERLFGAVQHALPNGVSRGLVKSYFQVNSLCRNGWSGMHSAAASHAVNDGLTVRILPALSDNYMYLIVDEKTKEAAVVDPVAPSEVLRTVSELGLKLATVLTTHHHWDHAGGNSEFVTSLTQLNADVAHQLRVVGGDERIDALTTKVGQDDVLYVGKTKIKCLSTPCHTSGHICYFVTTHDDDDQHGDGKHERAAVFTGDTLFLGGCGRFFEGTGQQMHDALINKLAKLPDDTLVFGGHEYSVANLRFAAHLEPDNEDVKAKLEQCIEKRSAQPPTPTGPSTLGEEKRYNPFMRVIETPVQQASGKLDAVEAMSAVRALKDGFKAK